MSVYYNEFDPYAAEWLRNLIKIGYIPDGEVDTRSIVDVQPLDLRGFAQCHFFAGIGGWSHALRLVGWPDDRPIWTGSCPCQPFSVAGKGAGTDDPRHLWPHFHRLISAVRPPVVMGEQVAGKAGYGWFDGVRTDLEGTGYAGRAVDIPALAVNAPHIRQRLYWVACDMADADHQRRDGIDALLRQNESRRVKEDLYETAGNGAGHMADADQGGRGRWPRDGGGERDGQTSGRVEDHGQPAGDGENRIDVENSNSRNVERRQIGEPGRVCKKESGEGPDDYIGGRCSSFWSDAVWLTGSDGKARRSQPGLPLLAHGLPVRVGRLRAYGNAVVPQLAAEVIKAFMECEL